MSGRTAIFLSSPPGRLQQTCISAAAREEQAGVSLRDAGGAPCGTAAVCGAVAFVCQVSVEGRTRRACFKCFSDLGIEPGPCGCQAVVPEGLPRKLNHCIEIPPEIALVLL